MRLLDNTVVLGMAAIVLELIGNADTQIQLSVAHVGHGQHARLRHFLCNRKRLDRSHFVVSYR